MYYYQKEFCSPYVQLMPVEYEKREDEQWHKVGVACDGIEACKIPLEQCKHFKAAPDIVSKDQLRETKLGQMR